jgi:endonuclease/exonuclease/phosphatase (EEP) superfamily protein YafD
VLAVLACGLTLVLTGCSGTVQHSAVQPGPAASPPDGRTFTLLQMNLCLSGLADCYRSRVDYPAGVLAAIAQIRRNHPDAVTFNEACSGDAARIARQTGYQLRFSKVVYYGKLFSCITPGNRGVFGDAVLTRSPITGSQTEAFAAQQGPEHRRWLCVQTRAGVQVCTAHLATAAAVEAAANTPQCTELTALLAQRAANGTVIFAGDLNRRSPCAPPGFWVRNDSAGHQDPGSQQAYGSGALSDPVVQVFEGAHTDHNVLLVRARLAG